MDDMLKNHGSCIRIYFGTETVVDPFEKNVEVTLLNSIPVRAIVTDLVSSQIAWKMPGIITEKAKEIFMEKKHRNLLEKSQKIGVKENNTWIDFEGWRVNGKFQIREEGNYIRCYIYSKHTS